MTPSPQLHPGHALLAIFLSFAAQMLFAAIWAPSLEETALIPLIVTVELTFFASAWTMLMVTGTVAYLPIGRPALVQGVASLLLGAGAFLFSGSTLAHLYGLLEGDDYVELQGESFAEMEAQIGIGGILFLVALLTPVCEELLFRGVVQRGFSSRLRPTAAWIVASLCFGIVHGHPVHILVATLLGLAAGWALWGSGTLWAAFLVHAANNTLATTGVPLLPGQAPPETEVIALPLLYLPVGIALLALGGWWLRPRPSLGPPVPETDTLKEG